MDSAKAPKGTAEKETAENKDFSLHVNPNAAESDLQVILDIPLRVSVELGRTKILVQDLLKLHRGSVVELSKLAGDALEILVNDKVVARGEVIVMNEKFGVRLTEIVSHDQRIRNLGG